MIKKSIALALVTLGFAGAASAATFGVGVDSATVKDSGVSVTTSAARAFVEAPVYKNLTVEAGVSSAHGRIAADGLGVVSSNARALDVSAKYVFSNGFNVRVGSSVVELAGVSDTKEFASVGYDYKLGAASVAKLAVTKSSGLDGVVPSVTVEYDLSKNIRARASVSKAEGVNPAVGLGVAYRF